MAVDATQDASPAGEAWHEFEATMAEIASLAKSERPLSEFSAALLEHVLQLLAAVGGAVWLTNTDGSLRLESQIKLDSLYAPHGPFSVESHQLFLKRALNRAELSFFPPQRSEGEASSDLQTSDYLLILCPLKVDQDVTGLIEVIQRPTADPVALRGHRRLLSMVTELVSDHLRRREILRLRQSQSESQRFERFVHKAHATLDLRAAGYELANEGRRFIGCDRVGVVIRRGGTYRLLATSGVDSINRRANAVRSLEKLATGMARFGQPYMCGKDAPDLPPQLEDLLQRYVDQSHSTALTIVPLPWKTGDEEQQEAANVGLLVAEQYSAEFDEAAGQRILQVASHSGLALKNALAFQALPTLPFARARAMLVTGPTKKWKTMVLALAVCAGMIAALIVVPMDFNVSVRGELQPQRRREVFAPFDGEISRLAVSHGDTVAAGDEILVLRSPQIELELQRVQGEYDTTRKRLLAIESALLQYDPGDELMRSRQSQLAAELEAVKQQLSSHRAQLQLLQEQQAKLRVVSPLGGMVLTWDLHRLLDNRPVQRGQSMMTIADLSGPWIAELEIPDDQIGFVMRAEQGLGAQVSLELAISRGTRYQGILRHISSRIDVNEENLPVVHGIVDLEGVDLPAEVRPGSTLFAKIHCGRKSVGYVWLHELFQAIQNWAWF